MKSKQSKVSCIIPAHNEEKTIKGVISACLKTPEIGEVIVVSDGSVDNTVGSAKSLKDDRVKVIELQFNKGKGYAVVKGIKEAKNKTILLLDADLVNLAPHLLSSLIWPVLEGRVDMTIASWYGKGISSSLSFWKVCGQRCLNSSYLEPYLKDLQNSGYGFELLLNEIFKNKRVVIIPWVGEKPFHIIKTKKNNEKWVVSYLKESFEVTKVFLKNKTKDYKKRFVKDWMETMSSYFRLSIDKLKEFLEI